MSSKILFILLIVGLVSIKVTNAQSVQDVVSSLGELIGAIVAGIVELVSQIVFTVLSAVTQLISTGINNPNDTSLSSVLSALTQLISNNSNDTGVSSVLSALSQLISTTSNNPNDIRAIGALFEALQQAIWKIANCGVLKNGKQYYLQSDAGWFKGGYVQASVSAVDSERGAVLTRQKDKASKFTAVQKSCNVYGLCVRGLCMSRCEGVCQTGTNAYQTVAFHVTDSTGSYSQWTLSSIGDDVASGPYKLKTDIEQYLAYARLRENLPIVSLNATLLPESHFKFIEVEPCVGILEHGQQYYLKSGNADYVVVKGLLAYLEQGDEASATKFRAVQWDCNVYGFCIAGTDGDQCMSRCQNCASDTMNYQSVQFHVNNSFRPYSQWTLLNSANSTLYTLYAEGQFRNVYFNTTSSGAKQLMLDLNKSLEFQLIKVT